VSGAARGRLIGSGAAAQLLGVSVDTLARYRRMGLPAYAVRPPGARRPHYVYRESEVRGWLEGFAISPDNLALPDGP
jgi:hypothetical protein